MDLIDQMDEPEKLSEEWINEHSKSYTMENAVEISDLKNLLLPQPKKPVIPQFVADWIEEERANIIDWHTEIPERFFLILGHKLHYTTLANTNVSDWVFSGNEEKLYQALKYGYEVEKEKLYRVIFPHTSGYNEKMTLMTNGGGYYIDEVIDPDFEVAELTEQEIKAIDERYWAFAEEVTE
ncbi:DUF1642 domain-containing protein [Jeotgalibaca sp. MA1X17-3]|uniref:DUF1642 domain-containing protein n=1 Tax=Jeotgalibaca sp. MA1X17-3 TaxID=2908211 RepID=UPI001F3DCC36|nr:DUF1642 domain-containing protein [Jeotgalibaca sp. MA1X17-3]UJF15080.1 DUF1642 domain-containing protein [Jeotgalibaca sp. MA1X17-3]